MTRSSWAGVGLEAQLRIIAPLFKFFIRKKEEPSVGAEARLRIVALQHKLLIRKPQEVGADSKAKLRIIALPLKHLIRKIGEERAEENEQRRVSRGERGEESEQRRARRGERGEESEQRRVSREERAGDGSHDVRGTSELRRPERSGDRVRSGGPHATRRPSRRRDPNPLGSRSRLFTKKVPQDFLRDLFVTAGDGNRTHVSSLEGWCSTIELHPHLPYVCCSLLLQQRLL